MKSNQAQILAQSVYQAIQDKKGKELTKVISNFSEYLNSHHLVTMIPKILAELEKIYFKDNSIVATKIASQQQIMEADLKKISQLVEKKTGKQVVIKKEEDQDLIGGAVIRYEDKIIDMSLRNQISKLAKQLSS